MTPTPNAPMPRLIPVIDVLDGLAVHAKGGRREDYRPVRSRLRGGPAPLGLARSIRDTLGLAEVYLADLDAIAGAPPALGLYRGLAALGLAPWIDAGVRDVASARAVLEGGPARLIVGLETVAGPAELGLIVASGGPGRVAFSLDLRDGRPILAPGADWGGEGPARIAARAIGLGIRSVILLDLARVGLDDGPGTLGLLDRLAAEHQGVEWVVGGGIGGLGEVATIGRAGASAVLVGSAIHDGRIGPGNLARWTVLGCDTATTHADAIDTRR